MYPWSRVTRRCVPYGVGSNNLITSPDAFEGWTQFTCAASNTNSTDPVGGSNGRTITAGAGSARHYMSKVSSASFVEGGLVLVSAYVKAGTAGFAVVGDDQHNSYFRAVINLSTGAIGSVNSGVIATSVSAGGGWWLVEVKFAIPADHTTVASCTVGPLVTDTLSSWTAAGTETCLAWRGTVQKRLS